MKCYLVVGALLAGLLHGVTFAQSYHPIVEVTSTTDERDGDLWPISNLIQGPGAGFEEAEPQNAAGLGPDELWVTNADAGFPADYVEEVEQPVIQFDLGEDRTLKEISVWAYSATNSNGTSQFSLRFATEAEGSDDGIFGAISYGDSITYNPTFDIFVDPSPQQYKLFSEAVTARYVELTNLDNYFVSPGTSAGPEPGQEIDPRLLQGLNTGGYLPGGDRVGLGEVAFMDLPASFQPGDKIPRSIGGDGLGTLEVGASQSGQEFGPAGEPGPGLLQEWYVGGPTNKGGVDAVFAENNPVIPGFRNDITSWFSGRYENDTDGVIPAFPEEIASVVLDGNTFVDTNPHAVRMTGEILLEESGLYRFTDAVDDFTYLAIDTDRSGVAGDSPTEVLTNDGDWTDIFTAENGGSPIAELDIQDIADGGEWLAMEFIAADNGTNGPGVLYWDYSTENGVGEGEFFPSDRTESLVDSITVEELMVPNTHLRSSERELINADANGSLADTVGQLDVLELTLQVGPDGADQIALREGVAVGEGKATLDVSGASVRIQASGDITDGTEFQILGADEVVGLDTFNLLLDDASLWDTSKLSQGIITFGASACNPDSRGDLDGNGEVTFLDFLVLAENFGAAATDHTTGDIDCSGEVGFLDFLILAENFGSSVARAESVPEPSSLTLLGFVFLFAGYFRRRR